MLPTRAACLLLPLLWPALGCDALQAFRTGPSEVFSGEVIGSDSKPTEPSFIRQGFDSHTQMDLTFDPALASKYVERDPATPATPQAPGTIDTYSCPPNSEFCEPSQRVPGHFQHSELEPIVNLTHDALSQYDFPGGGRLRNYIFIVRFQSPSDTDPIQRSAMVFLSLMEDGKVEARVIATSMLGSDLKTELQPALFGVFILERRKR
jgi:hypothetical protein